ncbi:hypothetical protein FRACYDRAFT_245143 [Fragilariopsis cylindrus CCMP1102]|uniref:Uncharacterized protein n=1 Tax=Fragilariopsis cylindrus CCMP1102 TaxID=635003 RepID=A0A1E7F1L8_9STRA|nr:hypothetical protein FRACYDRAFT_245143 [Fragilariopsis cylindrus CCMP1102]|eukprot:OEU12017.1 hypothetical protein FRACYDRAFT_245143 [Fragilariopsis cylindrus CCMP1102]
MDVVVATTITEPPVVMTRASSMSEVTATTATSSTSSIAIAAAAAATARATAIAMTKTKTTKTNGILRRSSYPVIATRSKSLYNNSTDISSLGGFTDIDEFESWRSNVNSNNGSNSPPNKHKKRGGGCHNNNNIWIESLMDNSNEDSNAFTRFVWIFIVIPVVLLSFGGVSYLIIASIIWGFTFVAQWFRKFLIDEFILRNSKTKASVSAKKTTNTETTTTNLNTTETITTPMVSSPFSSSTTSTATATATTAIAAGSSANPDAKSIEIESNIIPISSSSSSPIVSVLGTEEDTTTTTTTTNITPKPPTTSTATSITTKDNQNRVLCRDRVCRVRFEDGIKFPMRKKLRQSIPRINKQKKKKNNNNNNMNDPNKTVIAYELEEEEDEGREQYPVDQETLMNVSSWDDNSLMLLKAYLVNSKTKKKKKKKINIVMDDVNNDSNIKVESSVSVEEAVVAAVAAVEEAEEVVIDEEIQSLPSDEEVFVEKEEEEQQQEDQDVVEADDDEYNDDNKFQNRLSIQRLHIEQQEKIQEGMIQLDLDNDDNEDEPKEEEFIEDFHEGLFATSSSKKKTTTTTTKPLRRRRRRRPRDSLCFLSKKTVVQPLFVFCPDISLCPSDEIESLQIKQRERFEQAEIGAIESTIPTTTITTDENDNNNENDKNDKDDEVYCVVSSSPIVASLASLEVNDELELELESELESLRSSSTYHNDFDDYDGSNEIGREVTPCPSISKCFIKEQPKASSVSSSCEDPPGTKTISAAPIVMTDYNDSGTSRNPVPLSHEEQNVTTPTENNDVTELAIFNDNTNDEDFVGAGDISDDFFRELQQSSSSSSCGGDIVRDFYKELRKPPCFKVEDGLLFAEDDDEDDESDLQLITPTPVPVPGATKIIFNDYGDNVVSLSQSFSSSSSSSSPAMYSYKNDDEADVENVPSVTSPSKKTFATANNYDDKRSNPSTAFDSNNFIVHTTIGSPKSVPGAAATTTTSLSSPLKQRFVLSPSNWSN